MIMNVWGERLETKCGVVELSVNSTLRFEEMGFVLVPRYLQFRANSNLLGFYLNREEHRTKNPYAWVRNMHENCITRTSL